MPSSDGCIKNIQPGDTVECYIQTIESCLSYDNMDRNQSFNEISQA